MTDFSTITACGECCTGCTKKKEGVCPGCIEADGRVPEWAESGICRIHACCKEHNARFCGSCSEFPCDKLPEMIPWNPDIVQHLSALRDELRRTDAMQKRNIVLIGMPTSGKSTVGVILAKILEKDFIDSDIVIQKREGAALSEIIEGKGIDGFLKCEEQALLNIKVSDTVIATGGSVVYSETAMKHLSEGAYVIYLKLSLEDLKKRLKRIKERGVVMRPGESLEDMFAVRSELYERYADITVEEEGASVEDTVNAVVEALRKESQLRL